MNLTKALTAVTEVKLLFKRGFKFLFRCEECEMILSVNFEEDEERRKVVSDEMVLECPCGGLSRVLRD